MTRSTGKATWPGVKQVWRTRDAAGVFRGDVLALDDDPQPGEPLLQPLMRGGSRTGTAPALDACRRQAAAQISSLPSGLRGLAQAPAYPVEVAPALRALATRLDAQS